jgi:glycosyltransferase involved in cell wall biosynthesis
MKTYSKRIAFCISDQHLVPHGGIGQFAKGFTEMAKDLNWKVDLILDKASSNDFGALVESLGANIITSDAPMSYKNHTGTFAFTDSINFEKMLNFRNAIMKAFNTNLYDMIVCNSLEAMPAALSFDLNKYIPVVFYTHEESMVFRDTRKFKGVFSESCNEFFNNLMNLENCYIGTQSDRNVNEISGNGGINVKKLPMPMSERGLLVENNGTREGVLYIGRWEDRKNPEAFLKIIKETGLPAKIITNSNGKKKFEARLAELEITNYEIKSGVVGDEKVDFIKSAKVHFNPSLRENYPFTFFECLGHMPCVVIDKSEWVTNFDKKYYIRKPVSEAGEAIKAVYGMKPEKWYGNGALQYIKDLDSGTAKYWKDFVESYTPSVTSKSDSAKINEYSEIKYIDFVRILNRSFLAIDDVKSVLTNKSKYNIIYTDKDTYLAKDPTFVPSEKETDTLESLFA